MKKITFTCLNCLTNHETDLPENEDKVFTCKVYLKALTYKFGKNNDFEINNCRMGKFDDSITVHTIPTHHGPFNYIISEKQISKQGNSKSPNDLYDTLNEVFNYIESTNSDKYGKSPLPEMLGPDGKTINTFQIKKYLTRYMSKGFEKSELRSDLLKIIHYAMFELKRTKSKC